MLLADLVDEYKIEGEVEVASLNKIHGTHLKTDHGLLPAAFLFPVESKAQLQTLLDKLNQAKRNFHTVRTQVLYVDLPKLRG
jgi:hypothetical protein